MNKTPSLLFPILLSALFTSTGCTANPIVFEAVQAELFAAPKSTVNAWADYDNDGDLDLVVTFDQGEVRLYQNNQGEFTNVAKALGLPQSGNSVRAAAWGDYDNDGDVDLYLGYVNWQGPARNRLYRNDAGKGFVEVGESAGLTFANVTTRHVSWVDYDNDGDLDLFAAQRTGWNRLFENTGGQFKDVSYARGLLDPRRTVGAVWFDMDQDGDLDLFNANQSGDRDAFYRNDNGKFVDVAMSLDMDLPRRPISEGSVTSSVADFDNDGDLDLFVGTYGFNHLYRNDGDGRFTDVAASLGITSDDHLVGSRWGDFDQDGRIDLYLTGFHYTDLSYKDYLFRNTANGFVDVWPALPPQMNGDHSVQWADYDQDGDLDLALTSSHPKGTHPLFKNLHPKPADSLQIEVLDHRGHHTVAGAEVRLYNAKTGALLGTRLVDTGSGYDAQNAMPVHFALAGASRVKVEVTTMSQSGRVVNTLTNINPADYKGRWLSVRAKAPTRQ